MFLAVMLTCDIDVQVGRIDNPDRVDLRKGSDPEGYRGHRLATKLYQPPASEVIHLDPTEGDAWLERTADLPGAAGPRLHAAR